MPQRPLPPSELESQYLHYGLKIVNYGRSSVEVENLLKNQVKQLSVSSEGEFDVLCRIFIELLFRDMLGNEENIHYLILLNTIWGWNSGSRIFEPFTNKFCWHDGLLAARDLGFFSNNNQLVTRLDYSKFSLFNSCKKLLKSVQFLLDAGYECHLDHWKVHLTVKGEEKLNNRIKKLVGELGGVNLMAYILSSFERSGLYNSRLERYSLIRKTAHSSISDQQLVPFGLLFQFAVKDGKYRSPPPMTSNTAVLEQVVKLALHYGTLLNIPSLAGVTGIFGWNQILKQVRDFMVYNTVFLAYQVKPRHCAALIESIYSGFSDTLKKTHGWGIEEVQVLLKTISTAPNKVTIISQAELKQLQGNIEPI